MSQIANDINEFMDALGHFTKAGEKVGALKKAKLDPQTRDAISEALERLATLADAFHDVALDLIEPEASQALTVDIEGAAEIFSRWMQNLRDDPMELAHMIQMYTDHPDEFPASCARYFMALAEELGDEPCGACGGCGGCHE